MGLGLEGCLHERVVPLRDHRVKKEIRSLSKTGDVLHVAGIHVYSGGLTRTPCSLDLFRALEVPVADDDLIDSRMPGKVPGKDVSLLARADDDDFHGLPPKGGN